MRAAVGVGAASCNPADVADYRAESTLYVSGEPHLSYPVSPSEGGDVGKATDATIKAIEETNLELRGVLPRGSRKLKYSTLIGPLRLSAPLPRRLGEDAFGFIYEDFLSNFTTQGKRGGGKYFTPYSTHV